MFNKFIKKILFLILVLNFSIISYSENSELREIPMLENFSNEILNNSSNSKELKRIEKEYNLQVNHEKKIEATKNEIQKKVTVKPKKDTKIEFENSNLDNIKNENNIKVQEFENNSGKLFPIEIIEEEKAPETKITKQEIKNEVRKETENTKVNKIETPKEVKKKAPIQKEKSKKIEQPKKKKIIPKKAPTKKVSKKTNEKVNWNLRNNFRACLIGDLDGNIYYSKNADRLYPLASVTKVMTLLVTFDAIHAKKISLNSNVVISPLAARQGGSKIKLRAGQVYKLRDLIKASAIYSANNATYAIAEFVGGGSLKRFVGLMNKKVRKLGLQKDLKYYTPAGLPSRMTKRPMDVGTARAIYKLSIEALKYKQYIQIAGIKNTTIRYGTIKLRNRNHLLGKKGVYGIKTGYHREARYNITVASKIKNKRVVVVVLGGKTYKTRDKTVLDILNIFENNYYTLTRK